jgi:DNA-binding MarR family transcriptional regulator
LVMAQRRCAASIRQALVLAGFDDVPPSGARMIGAVARRRSPCTLVELSEELSITRQAASQLAEHLVSTGYCVRSPVPEDGRKILVDLSARGWAVAKELRRQSALVERTLGDLVGPRDLVATRRTLEILGEVDLESVGERGGERGGVGERGGERGGGSGSEKLRRPRSKPETSGSAPRASGDGRHTALAGRTME